MALGRVYRRLGHLRAERDLWRQRAEVDPADGDAAERIGWILWFTGQAAEAIPWLRKAIELRPSTRWAHFYIGNAYLRLSDYGGAEAAYRRSVELYPDHSSAHAGVTWTLLAAGRDDEARHQLATMRSSTLDGDRYSVKIADIELFLGDLDRAASDARRAAAEDREARYWPRGLCATTILGAAVLQQDPAEATAALDDSAALDCHRLRQGDEGPMPRYDLAAVHALRGEHGEARRWLTEAIAAGWWYPDLARRDPLLADLRRDAEFIAMMAGPS